MGRVKGSILLGVVKRAKREPGAQANLGERELRFLEGERVSHAEWYPIEICEALVMAIERALTGGNRSPLPWEFGVQMAKVQLSGTYRAFHVQGNPRRQLQRLPVIWKTFFDDGEWKCVDEEPGRIELRYSDSAARTDALCRAAGGFLEEASRMAGAEQVKVLKTTCRALGDRCCTYEVRWE